MFLDVMRPEHFKALYEISKRVEPLSKEMSYVQFGEIMGRRTGYVVISNEQRAMSNDPSAGSGQGIVGCISFSDYVKGIGILIHCKIDKPYQRRWINRKILKSVFGYVFNELNLERVSGYCIVEKSDDAGELLERLGFVHEGTIRKGSRFGDRFYDVRLYGILRGECKWIDAKLTTEARRHREKKQRHETTDNKWGGELRWGQDLKLQLERLRWGVWGWGYIIVLIVLLCRIFLHHRRRRM